MILVAIKRSSGHRVLATEAVRNEAPFVCPVCEGELVLKQGQRMVHHFAHKPPYNCSYSSGESLQHLRVKLAIYEALKERNNVDKLELERTLKGIRPDISFRVNGEHYVGIEFQMSSLSIDEITHRTKRYGELGIHVCWLLPWNPEVLEDKMSVKIWQEWLHRLYLGRLYYWSMSLDHIIPVHLKVYKSYVPEREWYDEYGEQHSSGGHYRDSIKYQKPVLGLGVDLINDFAPKQTANFTGGGFTFPKSKIWVDNQKYWWGQILECDT